MHLLRVMLKASGKRGVPQGGVISPVLSASPKTLHLYKKQLVAVNLRDEDF